MARSLLCVALLSGFLFACNNEKKPATDTSFPVRQSTMDSLAAEISRARQLQDVGKASDALRITDAMLRRFPGQLDALNLKADILKSGGKPDEALTVLERAYALQPRDKETAYNLAFEYADGKNAKALALTDTLLKYDKTETVARAWYIKAHYYNRLGNEGEAFRYFDSSMTADYNFLDAYLDKGQILFRQKKYDAALKAFALGQKISPAAAEFYLWVAKTQEAMGDKANAKTNYERAFALDKTLTEAKDAAAKL